MYIAFFQSAISADCSQDAGLCNCNYQPILLMWDSVPVEAEPTCRVMVSKAAVFPQQHVLAQFRGEACGVCSVDFTPGLANPAQSPQLTP